MSNILVIGYGNSLRGDDSVGPRLSERIGDQHWPGVKTLAIHQLVPELAETIAASDQVIFIDARIASEDVEVARLESERLTEFSTHRSDPRELLALTRAIHGRCPPAWWVTLPARSFQYEEALTPVARRGMEEAFARIRDLCRSVGET